MGGYGSGRWYRCNSKATAESQDRIDIRCLKKQGYLRPRFSGLLSWSLCNKQKGSIVYRMEGDHRMVLNYRHRPHDGEWETVEQAGGHRTWFLCPLCWKRVAVLYCADKYFFCRHCYDLTYSSQQESRPDRLMRKARKIRKKIGGGVNLLDPFPDKPKNMHWETYWRLRERAEYANTLSWLNG